jgi:hypothetical protein
MDEQRMTTVHVQSSLTADDRLLPRQTTERIKRKTSLFFSVIYRKYHITTTMFARTTENSFAILLQENSEKDIQPMEKEEHLPRSSLVDSTIYTLTVSTPNKSEDFPILPCHASASHL